MDKAYLAGLFGIITAMVGECAKSTKRRIAESCQTPKPGDYLKIVGILNSNVREAQRLSDEISNEAVRLQAVAALVGIGDTMDTVMEFTVPDGKAHDKTRKTCEDIVRDAFVKCRDTCTPE